MVVGVELDEVAARGEVRRNLGVGVGLVVIHNDVVLVDRAVAPLDVPCEGAHRAGERLYYYVRRGEAALSVTILVAKFVELLRGC